MVDEANKLENLLSEVAAKERRYYRRATLYIALVALVALGWLSYSAFKVVSLERRASALDEQIQIKLTEAQQLSAQVESKKAENQQLSEQLAQNKEAIDQARKALEEITATGDAKKQAREAQKALETLKTAKKRSDQLTVATNPPSAKQEQPARPSTNLDERAREAIVNALSNVSPLATKPINFDRTLADYGITDGALIAAFIMSLKSHLPEIKDKIDKDLSSLKPGVRLGTIFNVIRSELASTQS